ncbi:hypothetical protein C8F04DRAFT_1290825 [Mycena alexandri]|uniref:Uncharacterized protein n=1 Tax=Mycena alexandri TaxID=1745969 RepID=A0AAD6WYV8_9AGAR|nr:hypothetical protein C8F04DRAFT_1290825 [Mycena alexandri]
MATSIPTSTSVSTSATSAFPTPAESLSASPSRASGYATPARASTSAGVSGYATPADAPSGVASPSRADASGSERGELDGCEEGESEKGDATHLPAAPLALGAHAPPEAIPFHLRLHFALAFRRAGERGARVAALAVCVQLRGGRVVSPSDDYAWPPRLALALHNTASPPQPYYPEELTPPPSAVSSAYSDPSHPFPSPVDAPRFDYPQHNEYAAYQPVPVSMYPPLDPAAASASVPPYANAAAYPHPSQALPPHAFAAYPLPHELPPAYPYPPLPLTVSVPVLAPHAADRPARHRSVEGPASGGGRARRDRKRPQEKRRIGYYPASPLMSTVIALREAEAASHPASAAGAEEEAEGSESADGDGEGEESDGEERGDNRHQCQARWQINAQMGPDPRGGAARGGGCACTGRAARGCR